MRRLHWAHVLFIPWLAALPGAIARVQAYPPELWTVTRELAGLSAGAVILTALCRYWQPTWRSAAILVSSASLMLLAYDLRSLVIVTWPWFMNALTTKVSVLIWALTVLPLGIWIWRKARREPVLLERGVWWIVVSCVVASLFFSSRGRAHIREGPPLADVGDAGEKRDIYYIILDSYPSFRSLRDDFGFVDTAFEARLRDRGFQVVDDGRSNYAFTYPSLASTLNMDLLQNLPKAGSNAIESMGALINQNRVMKYLGSQGYALYHIGLLMQPGAGREVLRLGYVNPSLGAVLNATPFQRVGLYTYEPWETRVRVRREFDALKALAARPGPKFVYAHILCPHPPFAFGPNGESVSPLAARADPTVAFRDQVAFVNGQMESLLNALMPSDQASRPVVILQGDHGGAYVAHDGLDVPGTATPQFKRAQLAILNAYYFPEDVPARIPSGVTPVNSFRLVLNALFKMQLPAVADRSYFSTHLRPEWLEDLDTGGTRLLPSLLQGRTSSEDDR